MNNTSVTILIDNHAGPGCISEHGFSLWIEAVGKNILFDTGQHGEVLFENAKALNMDLPTTDALILSHGHYDHTGGMPELLKAAPQADIYYHPDLFTTRYAVTDDIAKNVSISDSSKDILSKVQANKIHRVSRPEKVADNVFITGEIPRVTDFETTGGNFHLNQAGTAPDHLLDDLAIWIETDLGLVVCTGCCHSGIINTLQHIKNISNSTTIHTLIGGLHLLNASNQRLTRTIQELSNFSIQQLVPCHCTGDRATELLKQTFACTPGYAGMNISF